MAVKITTLQIQKLLADYKKTELKNPCSWLNICKGWKGKRSKVQMDDALLKFCTKSFRNTHYYRIRKSAMKNLNSRVKPLIPQIQKMKTFEDVYQCLLRIRITGIGDLTVYDLSLLFSACIGLNLDKEPRYIYPHAGVSIGINRYCGFPKNRRTPYTITELDKVRGNVFSKSGLSPASLENFFCVYKSVFGD